MKKEKKIRRFKLTVGNNHGGAAGSQSEGAVLL
jgi:hypothetical protein